MLMPILLGTKMSFRLDGLPALNTERSPTIDNFQSPACQAADLCPRAPKTHNASLFRGGVFK